MNISAVTTSLSAYQTGSITSGAQLKTEETKQNNSQLTEAATLTISAEGMAMSNQSQAVQEAVAALTSTDGKDESASITQMLEESTLESETSTTTDLSSLSEEEISALVAEGTITQAQANTEIASRKTADQE